MTERLPLIEPEPKLAEALRERQPLIIPEDIYDWAVSWVEDIGGTIRSHEFMVSYVTGSIISIIRGLVGV